MQTLLLDYAENSALPKNKTALSRDAWKHDEFDKKFIERKMMFLR